MYIYFCINSLPPLWSTRSTFRVLAFQTLFALEFRAAAALHQKKAEQNKNTHKPYNDVAQMHACYGVQKRRTNVIECKSRKKPTLTHTNANEIERTK